MKTNEPVSGQAQDEPFDTTDTSREVSHDKAGIAWRNSKSQIKHSSISEVKCNDE